MVSDDGGEQHVGHRAVPGPGGKLEAPPAQRGPRRHRDFHQWLRLCRGEVRAFRPDPYHGRAQGRDGKYLYQAGEPVLPADLPAV